ncbi:hypothetical protein HDIA_2449 [Hartmannibacter diazotrophicus]|uniref:Uncharacterized protein n=1 Tax=Hartmannibacter diazotrophicus TaxID=1482074 RepID=A0A2C9D725_9HYPH|nr:hypothetical protein [Hartmannibacter diazotrophicus]SON55990.1 hypothetical protein HDIA_2449 [Hartmannibacter diazotrophicus]
MQPRFPRPVIATSYPQIAYPRPEIDDKPRADEAKAQRIEAARFAAARPHRPARSNGEEAEAIGFWPANFSKGLPHDQYGLVCEDAYCVFVNAVNCASPSAFLPRLASTNYSTTITATPIPSRPGRRAWAHPRAGHLYDLEGPDAAELSLPPAPALGSAEVSAEMAELYALSLLRDVPFAMLEKPEDDRTRGVQSALASLTWFSAKQGNGGQTLETGEARRQQARKPFRRQGLAGLMRGFAPGADRGPTVSQFLLVGTACSRQDLKPEDGIVRCGPQRIDQRIVPSEPGIDFMTGWSGWLDVQNGADVCETERLAKEPRFVATPRDLAAHAHSEFVHQAALNACMLLIGLRTPFERSLPIRTNHPWRTKTDPFGPCHALTLVAEAASRAAKAIQRQKFCVHRRARPEAVAGMITLAAGEESYRLGLLEPRLKAIVRELRDSGLAELVDAHNRAQNEAFRSDPERALLLYAGEDHPDWMDLNLLLSMAFPEGSPMSPSYGSCHAATVGASVTILKAMFDLYRGDGAPVGGPNRWTRNHWREKTLADVGVEQVFEAAADGSHLVESNVRPTELTLAGELNKVVANISHGCCTAGANYFSDCFEAMRLGERVAAGILQEQMLNHSEPIQLRFPSFDGDKVIISTTGSGSDVTVDVWAADDRPVTFEQWWLRQVSR